MNYTMIAPPLNQAQIVARLAGATIAPAQVNATTHIDAPSLRYDGTDILARANTWTAAQTFDRGANGNLVITTPDSVMGLISRTQDTEQRNDIRFHEGRIALLISSGTFAPAPGDGINVYRTGLAIGATALAASERLRVAGGTAPGTPAATDCLFGAGVGRFGAQVDAAHFRMSTYSTPGSGSLHNAPIGNAGFVRCPITGTLTITGLEGGADGRWLIIYNTSTGNSVTLKHEDAGSLAANQIRTQTNSDVTFSGRRSVMLLYDAGTSKWVPLLFGL